MRARGGLGLRLVLALVGMCCAMGFLVPAAPAVTHSAMARPLGAAAQPQLLDGQQIRGPLKPVANFILVKMDERSVMSDGGIVMPDQSPDKPQAGTVVAAGPGRHHPHTGTLIPMCVSEGDRVIFSKWSGTRMKYNLDEHMLVMDDDLLLVQTGSDMELTIEGLKMIRDQVLVRMQTKEETTDVGVVVAAQTASKAQAIEGEVVAVGPGRSSSIGELTPMHVKAGDFVRFRQFAGVDLTIKGSKYAVVRMVDVLSKASSASAASNEGAAAGGGGDQASAGNHYF
jgi:chaperonin GroES